MKENPHCRASDSPSPARRCAAVPLVVCFLPSTLTERSLHGQQDSESLDKRLVLRLGGPVRTVAALCLVAWTRNSIRGGSRILRPLPVVAQPGKECEHRASETLRRISTEDWPEPPTASSLRSAIGN
jgi:hypothetical protein